MQVALPETLSPQLREHEAHGALENSENDAAVLNINWGKASETKGGWVTVTKAPQRKSARDLTQEASSSGRDDIALQRREWLKQAKLLRQKQQILEKECKLPRDAFRNVREVEEEIRLAEEARKQLRKDLWRNHDVVKACVERVKAMLDNIRPGPDYVHSLAAAMNEAERELTVLKEAERVKFDELVQQEQLLTRDLELVAERMEGEAWDTAKHPARHATKLPNSVPRQPQDGGGLLPEVLEYEAFLQQHGETGGWDEEDHGEFERILAACRGDYSHTVLVCCDQMIGFRREDIIAHARWLAEHNELQVKKRLAVHEWRAKRDAEKAAALARAALEPESARRAQAEREQRHQHERLWREHQRLALEEWKAEKAAAEREAAEREAQEAAVREAQARAEEAERRRAERERLEAYRQQKAEEQEATRQAAEAAAGAASGFPVDADRARRLAERNDALLRRRGEAAAVREREQREKEARIEKMRHEVSEVFDSRVTRDPQRLLRPTSALQLRSKADKEEGHAPKPSGFIRNMPHKAVPAWRQPLRGID